MKNKYVVIKITESNTKELELVQDELFNLGYDWYNYNSYEKRTYINGNYILLYDNNKLITVIENDISYMLKNNNITVLDIKTFIRYTKIKKIKNQKK